MRVSSKGSESTYVVASPTSVDAVRFSGSARGGPDSSFPGAENCEILSDIMLIRRLMFICLGVTQSTGAGVHA